MNAQNIPQATIDLTGEGTVNVIPDQVTVKVRVENTGDEAQMVKRQNDEVVSKVLAFLKGMKISERDYKTEYLRLAKNYEHNTKSYNYAANQAISIQLKDLSKYEDLMDGLLKTGINRIDGVTFTSSDNDALESQARKNAVLNAKMKAEEYAGALNQTIGKAVSISEFSQNSIQPTLYRGKMAASSDGSGQTMAPGELEIKVTVNVSFVLN